MSVDSAGSPIPRAIESSCGSPPDRVTLRIDGTETQVRRPKARRPGRYGAGRNRPLNRPAHITPACPDSDRGKVVTLSRASSTQAKYTPAGLVFGMVRRAVVDQTGVPGAGSIRPGCALP
ncbi:hypothetical protein E7Y31_15195 [Candidatus Frankia alpina]|uniref:Transposase n=1 Tax=Candidatus Frankia alpina TaxID=2699483 RepID=A0A4S5EHN2_9ACTN|nr:hypothetical protein E7Y31_15195 [Candidatus Frankia alpina]